LTPLDRILARYRAALCGSTGLMVAISWPLWVDDPNFPRVPFFASFPSLPGWVSVVLLAGVLISLTLATIGWGGRLVIGVSLGFLAVSVFQDQNRFHPWVYQYLVVGLALVCVSPGRALRMARCFTIGLYVYSGLSKLDASFCLELGPTFLGAATRPLGLSIENWPEGARSLAVLSMPGFEIGLAALLSFSRTRCWGLFGSLVLHGALIGILGPWNLGHSLIVLAWNLALVVENLALFGWNEILNDSRADFKFARPAWVLFGLAMTLPAFERLGFCDAWPAHAVYASHAERFDIFIHEDDLDRFPETIRKRIGPANATPWRRLDLTAWSRDVRGTPTYPSARVGNAVAEFLEMRYGGLQPVRLVQWGRAALLDARRERDESFGLKAIRRRGDRFFLNAHPAL
jgi:hypothetical protein